MLLTKSWQYRNVYSQGQRVRGKEFSLICLPNSAGHNRLGVSVHGVKLAVRRNRIKRIVREFFRQNREVITPASDVVFAVRSGFAYATPQEISLAVRKLLEDQAGRRIRG
ncbi:MAG TPA: ribonuclease P protein component [Deltaproteobacteria bacterium]|nr:ribonuclease P protein component [Deltaproteobacteria bacterium]